MSHHDPSRTPDSLIHIPFHGDELLVVNHEGKPFILFRPVIEHIGLNYSSQLEKLKGKSWANPVLLRGTQVADQPQRREQIAVDVRTLLMLLATVDENRVADHVRAKLIAYQAEVADAIEAYWSKGIAVNPRVDVEEAAKVIAIFSQAKVGDPGYWDAKARQLTGRVLGESPEYDQSTKPLTVSTYLAQQGVTGKRVAALAGKFGKRLKALFVAEFGEEPPVIEDMVNRHIVKVAQYQEQHRPLFDRVFMELAADAA